MLSTRGPAQSGPAPSAPDRRPHDEQRFTLSVRLYDGFAQTVNFDAGSIPLLAIDEPPPLGTSRGPNPVRLLGAAVGGCLGASLLFCLRKARVEVHDLRTIVEGTLSRNDTGRLRVASIRVKLVPTIGDSECAGLERCAELFEDYCIVTESVREGIEIAVEVAAPDPTTSSR